MRFWISLLASIVCSLAPAAAQTSPLRVFLRGGPKTHGPGEHDHPKFVEEWTTLLRERGATVDGALVFPTAEQLERSDVLVMYAADGGSIHGEERTNLERFLARGGGLVVLHDAACGDDPQWFKTVVGGAWEHGYSRYLTGPTDLYLSEARHPITDGAANFRFEDEIYWDLHMQPEANVLMVGFHSVFDITPQMWTYEKDGYRAVVSLQGHYHDSFSHAAWRTLLLRSMAWSGKREVDSLLKPGEAEGLAYPKGGPTRPDAAAEQIDVHPDFDLSLVAAEPLVLKPIAIDWDARGRTWVAMTPGYPFKEQFSGVAAHDELAILVDTNSDGRLDERKTFFRGLDLATSFVLHRDGAIVTAAPDILFLRDTDGDDECDRVEKLFTGFGFGDTHAVMSNLRWGPDGWIYGTQGYSGGASNHVTNAAGRDFGKIGNGLFRFRPDGSAIEIVSSYGSNTWGCSFTPDGELFFTMANGAHLRHVVTPEKSLAGARLENVTSWIDIPDHDRVFPAVVRTEAPYAQIDFVGGFTAAAGSTFYDGGAWPAEWNNAHFVREPTVNLVHHDVVEPKGVTFQATKAREAEFIASRDLWFRPVDARVGPDGALYVLDFYNQAVVHNDTRGPKHGPTNAAIRPDRDHSHGRIWRVQHKRSTPNSNLTPLALDAAKLPAELSHPNAWVRNTTVRLAVESANRKVEESVRTVLDSMQSPRAKAAAAWILARRGAPCDDVFRWMRAPVADPALARTAVRIAATAPRGASELAIEAALLSTLNTNDARLRLLALNALADGAFASRALQRAPLAALDLPAVDDPWTRSAIVRWISSNAPAYVEALYDRGAARVERYAQPAVAVAIQRDAANALPALLQATVNARDEDATELRVRVLEGVASASKSVPHELAVDQVERLRNLISESDERIGIAALSLVNAWELDGEFAADVVALGERLQARLADANEAHERRCDALHVLLRMPSRRAAALEAGRELVEASKSVETQLRVIETLAGSDDPGAARLLTNGYAAFEPAAREAAFERLAARASWTVALLDQIALGGIAMKDLGPQKLHRLRNHPDATTSQRATKLFESLAGASNAQVNALIASLLPQVDQPGDRAHGKLVFEQNCASCHTAFGAGGAVGPDLSGIGAHGARDLLPIILDPNRTVEAAYAEWIVTTHDERNFAGVLVREGDDGVVLRSSAGDATIAREDIAEIRNTGRSPMPAGFESLGADSLRDLIAYLAGDFANWRVLDLKPVVSSDSTQALYDSKRDDKRYAPAKYGVVPLDGVPFEFLDPRRTDSRCNALVLKGGLVADWESKVAKPQRVEIAVGATVQRVHVLGGIAGWGFPYIKESKPIVKWTWVFADGSSEEQVLHNGVEFADWIGRYDVPGSEFVEGALAEDSWGQLRRFVVEPSRAARVEKIVLESYDNELAPTFLALTAELPGAPARAEKTVEPVDVLVFGGGSSHDFDTWYDKADLATLKAAGVASARYTASLNDAARQLDKLQTLVLCTNQPIAGERFKRRLFEFVGAGGGLVVLHPSNWFNWTDWPEYNAQIVGGGSRSHEKLQEFEVRIVDPNHAVTRGAPSTFRITDELYRFEPDPNGAAIHVLAIGRSLETGAEYPVLWEVARANGRTIGFTLGHDGDAHELPAFQTLLTNAVRWTLGR